ncbi:MAG: cytochrome d ubiquinol oxidase subunit II [Actinobacteria bacterium]|nr:cytochrome d ubiquinol oxidase subunit II [Actinomycetota bacterium]
MSGLQTTWFVIGAALVAVYAVLDGFDLGIGILSPILAREDEQRAMLRHTVSPVWDSNEVWLIIIGGVLFAAFPGAYATILSGFYLVFMLVFFGLIARATALGLHYGSVAPSRRWRTAFWAGSVIPSFLLGITVGNLVRGVGLTSSGDFSGSLVSLFNPFSIGMGILALALFANQGAAWASLKSTGELHVRSVRVRRATGWALLALFVLMTAYAAGMTGTHAANMVRRPLGWVVVLLALAGIACQQFFALRGDDRGAFAGASAAMVGFVGIWAVGSYPVIVPALDGGAALTAASASAGSGTLKVMVVVAALGIPVAAASALVVYRVFRGRVDGNPRGE